MKNTLNLGENYSKKVVFWFLLLFILSISFTPSKSLASFISFPNKIDTYQERLNVQIVLNLVMSPSPSLKVDGKLGEKSIKAIQVFQELKGLISDGIIGAKTRLALELAQSIPVGCSYGALFNSITGQSCAVDQNTTNTPLVYNPDAGFQTPPVYEPKIDPVVPENKSTTIIYPSIAISSPVNNTTIGTNTVSLNFNATNVTTCWYDLGGLRVEDGSIGDPSNPLYQYSLPNCQSKTITLPNNDYVLNIWAKDASGAEALDSTWFRVFVATTDITPPTVTAFGIPPTSTTLTVPVSPFSATDNIGVTAHLLTETSTTPSPTSSSWTTTTPTSYTFSSTGSKTLYAWARDAAGNISSPLSSNIIIQEETPVARMTYAVDHTNTNITSIPQSCINKAKTLNIAYVHTSHGSQLYSGMNAIKSYDPLYNFSSTGGSGILAFHDYIWNGLPTGSSSDLSTANGAIAASTTNYLNNQNYQDVDVVLWSWCDIAGHDVLGYLNNMKTLITTFENGSAGHPKPVKFVFFTAHANGGGPGDSSDSKNNIIRNFVNDTSPDSFCSLHECILYDFADIENYDPSNNYYLNKRVEDGLVYDCLAPYTSGAKTCNWSAEYLNNNPGSLNASITNLVSSCAHSPENTTWPESASAKLNCALKGQAAWYLFARMAGWDGISNTCDPVLGVSTYHFTQKLELGSKGNEVKELQKILINKGYLSSIATGYFGSQTLEAVKRYQKDNNLEVDGVVGNGTRAVLNKITV